MNEWESRKIVDAIERLANTILMSAALIVLVAALLVIGATSAH